MSRKVFTAGEVLAAADVNSFLMDQAVMSFAGTAARGSAIPSPVEGMVTYNEAANLLEIYDGSAYKVISATTGNILQVLSTTKTDAFSTASNTFVDVTGLSVSITPKSSSSKILVTVTLVASASQQTNMLFNLLRNSTAISQASAGTDPSTTAMNVAATSDMLTATITFLDSPATVSATTYKIQTKVEGGTGYINRRGIDAFFATTSSITAMEVSA
jgi:hypothetical protein